MWEMIDIRITKHEWFWDGVVCYFNEEETEKINSGEYWYELGEEMNLDRFDNCSEESVIEHAKQFKENLKSDGKKVYLFINGKEVR